MSSVWIGGIIEIVTGRGITEQPIVVGGGYIAAIDHLWPFNALNNHR